MAGVRAASNKELPVNNLPETMDIGSTFKDIP